VITVKSILREAFTKKEVRSLIFVEVILGIFASATSLFLYIYITNAVLGRHTSQIDSAFFNLIYSVRQENITAVMLFISYLGSEVIIFTSIIIVIFLTIRKHRRETVIFALMLLMGVAATTTLKLLYKVPRPGIFALTTENSYSYPSGHALNSLLFYGAISYFVYHFTKNKKLSVFTLIMAIILVFLIGLSRVYLGVHHASDILAGFITGFWLLTTTILIDKTITFFSLISERNKTGT
jgi:undecaprenyl-diphosphatase